MSVRTDFIETSVYEILQQGVAAAECLHYGGIESYPILDYLLQSVFLRMTGFEEQKLRNICWEVATVDLEYRYKTLQGHISYGEFSTLDDKKGVYTLLKEETKKFGGFFAVDTQKTTILDKVKKEMTEAFDGTLISRSFPNNYHQYEIFVKTWKKDHFANGNQLLSGQIEKVYNALYKQRNRCAHNTASYQQDMITLTEMQDSQMRNCNYFSYFAILLLLDKIFIESYRMFREAYRNIV